MAVTIKMVDVAKEFLSDKNILAYRPDGVIVRKKIENLIIAGKNDITYVLDFQGVKLSDTSFLDETVVELTAHCHEHRYDERLVAVSNLSEATEENLYSAILYRLEVKNQKVPIVDLSQNKLRVISNLEDSLLSVLDLIKAKGKITAIELVELLDLELNSASMRLKRLYDYGFLHRQGELVGSGKRFIYYAIGK